jgi:predicted alternative tryptophan synthase beta-subunit
MATPEEILIVIAPTMSATASYDVYIELAKQQTSSGYFGVHWGMAVALRAAHMWTLNSMRSGQSGVITYLMEGRLSKSFGGVGVIREELQLTNYGMQLLGLMDSMPGSVGTVASEEIINTYLGGGL